MVNTFTHINKRTITSHLNLLNTNKITIYDVGNPGPGLEQAQTGCGVKPVYGIPTSDFHSNTPSQK